MKKSILTFFSLAFAASTLFAGNPPAEKTYQVNSEKSKVQWFAEKVTGTHNGTVTVSEGSFTLADGKLVGGEIVVDMNTITVLDLQGEWKGKLENHLKSDDFFSVEKFETATITITDVKTTGEGTYKVGANLTIKGNTNRVEFDAIIKTSGKEAIASAELVIDRSKYDVRYGSGSFFDDLGDKTIYDDFKLKVELVAQ